MSAIIVVGAQWGDEGKGKVVDIAAEQADVVVRYAGGPNAGHTLVVDGDKLIMRLMPSGILRRHTTCLLAQGMVIDPHVLTTELAVLASRGVPLEGRLFVSDRATLILPYHIEIDTMREAATQGIGTTKRGVGPAYEDKMARRAVRLGLLSDRDSLAQKVTRARDAWLPVAAAMGGTLTSVDDIMEALRAPGRTLGPLLADTQFLVNEALRAKKNVLFEGAQGTLLDVDHGTYPFVTSSSAVAGGACTGAGVGPSRIDSVLGITKAYTTRVGAGPFPTELHDRMGDTIRQVGGEFGSVTGRPRRVGWLDLVLLRYAVAVNGIDALALTKLDVLAGIPEIPVCTRYRTEAGTVSDHGALGLAEVTPEYDTLAGFDADLSKVTTMAGLPREATRYVEYVEDFVRCPIALVSVGQGREETLLSRDLWPAPRRLA